MNEAELVLAWGEITDHIWTIVQFWASISFGVIAVAHFSPERLNHYLVVFVVFLYTIFSVFCAGFFISDVELLLAVYEEAELLLSERGQGSIFLNKLANYTSNASVPFVLLGFPSIYLGSIAYLIYRYRGADLDG